MFWCGVELHLQIGVAALVLFAAAIEGGAKL
jgi:hypothetical protein